MKQKVTIKDVASRAGVSLSTVSFVLNNSAGQTIPEKTRTKIYEAVKELGYSPNYMARHMRMKQVRSIGIVTAYNVKYIYFLDMLDGIMAAADKNDFAITICNDSSRNIETPNFLKYYQEKRIDGVIFISSAHSEDSSNEKDYIKLLKDHAIPYVVIYGYTSDRDTSYVNMDFFQNSYDACKHLYDRGCTNLMYIAPTEKNSTERYLPRTERDRINGYIESLSLVNKKENEKNVTFLPRDFRASADYDKIFDLFGKSRNFDGVVACWATYGMQVLNIARDLNITIPKDLRVIALDSLPYLQHTYPALSSMRLPFFEIALKGTELLISKLLNNDMEVVKLNISCELNMRSTS